MPFKSKETAWIYLILSIIAFWFKGGIVFIVILWSVFFLIDLPRDIKELKKYNKNINPQDKPEKGNDDCSSVNQIRNSKEEEIGKKSKEVYENLMKTIDEMNCKFNSLKNDDDDRK